MRGTRCLEVTLDKPQKEWIAIREIQVERLNPEASDKATDKAASQVFLQPRKHAEPASYAVQHAFEAAAVGFLAGSAAWLVFWNLSKHSELGQMMSSFGCFGPWSLTFLLVMDLALVGFVESPPQSVLTTKPAQPPQLTQTTVCKNGKPRKKLPIDWRWLRPGISFVDKALVKHLGPANDPRQHGPVKSQMSIGVIAEDNMDADFVAKSIKQLVESGAGHATVAVLVAQTKTSERRKAFLHKLLQKLQNLQLQADSGLLHILDPAEALYPEPPARTDNIDLALLTAFLEPLSETFMFVELDSVLVQDYPGHAQRYIDYLDASNIPWIVIEFDSLFGVARKLVRSRLLPRLRESWCEMVRLTYSYIYIYTYSEYSWINRTK